MCYTDYINFKRISSHSERFSPGLHLVLSFILGNSPRCCQQPSVASPRARVPLQMYLTSSGVTAQGLSFGLYFFGLCVLQVAGLFHHASIGNPINIAIVRLILLEDEEVKRKQGDSPSALAARLGYAGSWP